MGRKWTDPFLKSFIETRTFKLVNVENRPHVKVNVGGKVHPNLYTSNNDTEILYVNIIILYY